MIFDAESFCTAAEIAELDGKTPKTLTGAGLWVGVLSRGGCLLNDGVEFIQTSLFHFFLPFRAHSAAASAASVSSSGISTVMTPF